MSSSNDVKMDAIVSRMKAASSTPADTGAPSLPTSSRTAQNLARDTNDALTRAIRMNEMTNEVGGSALSSLGKQGETIQKSINTVEDTAMNLRDSRRTLRDMRVQYWKDRLGKALVILCLLMIIALIVYTKWFRRWRTSANS